MWTLFYDSDFTQCVRFIFVRHHVIIFFCFTESPVPLEFTPVLGILIGVVVTLLLVAFVIMLILRLKYKNTSTRSKQQQQQNQIQVNFLERNDFTRPAKIDLNKKWSPKQQNIQNFNIDTQGFRETKNENPPLREVGVIS